MVSKAVIKLVQVVFISSAGIEVPFAIFSWIKAAIQGIGCIPTALAETIQSISLIVILAFFKAFWQAETAREICFSSPLIL